MLAPLVLLLAFIAGCASNKEIVGKRDPAELYGNAMSAYLSGKNEEAERSFKALLEDHPLSVYAIEAELMMGDVSYAMEKYDEASSYYTSFVAMHPNHPKADYALFQKGMSHFRDVLTIDRDQTSTRKALFAFEDLLAAYPASSYSAKAGELAVFLRKRLADRELYIARFYFKSKNYKGALGRLRDILKQYPDAGINDQTLYYIGESYTRLGEKRLAEEAFSTLITDYPGSPFAKDAKARLKDS